MKKVSYLLILLFIFTLSLHKASAADVWLGFDEAWATTPEVRMYNLGNMNKPSKCAVGKFVVGISWFQSPEGLENESVHVDCISALDNYTYRSEYNFQPIQEWQESEPIYSEIDPSFGSPDYEYCVYQFPGEEVPTLNMIDSILEFIGLKKTYAIEQPVEGEQAGHWLCYKTVTVTRDVAQETTVSTQNNPVAFAYGRL